MVGVSKWPYFQTEICYHQLSSRSQIKSQEEIWTHSINRTILLISLEDTCRAAAWPFWHDCSTQENGEGVHGCHGEVEMAELLTETNRMHEHAKKYRSIDVKCYCFNGPAQHNCIMGKTI